MENLKVFIRPYLVWHKMTNSRYSVMFEHSEMQMFILDKFYFTTAMRITFIFNGIQENV